MKIYWCYTCQAERLPHAADECAAWDHFVVDLEKKAQIDAAKRARESMPK